MFNRLAPPLQRALWELGWQGLRDSQQAALPLILDTRNDVLISAATAAGKTEAAFLPLLTRLWQGQSIDTGAVAPATTAPALSRQGVILYVAPVKALINDQVERLHVFCERMDIPVYPWHGDVGPTSRRKFFADPRGVVLITPESLESLLFRRGAELRGLFARLEAVVVDELHAFIGNVRGCQLQSLLHRLELQLGRLVQRIGLSATLGDMGLAAEFLRPGHGPAVHSVTSAGEKRNLQLAVKAILRTSSLTPTQQDAEWRIADELFERLRGANYLVFPAGVGMVEFYADALRKRCEDAGLPVTYFPHHGRLAKSEREETESELKRGPLPVSAICTTTLEMGIDIGAIKGVVQIGAPQTVASLCQRIGRAGRRAGDVAVLWQYCIADLPGPGADCPDSLQQDLLQAVAVIQLFLAKWYEPPRVGALHYSTLIQQVLSLAGERHGISAAQTYQVLCQSGPFNDVTEANFIALLRAMVAKDLLMQDANKLLLHGLQGERLVNHYTFYAAFPDSQEYRLADNTQPAWLDADARRLLHDAQQQYQALQLDQVPCVQEGTNVYLFLWQGDLLQEALVALLQHQGEQASNEGIGIVIKQTSLAQVNAALASIASQPCPRADEILNRKQLGNAEKWDWVLPDDLFLASYASRALALDEAHTLCQSWPCWLTTAAL